MRHAFGAVVVSLFAVVFLHGAWLIRLLNPPFIRYLRSRPSGRTERPADRARPDERAATQSARGDAAVADRRFVQAAYGEVGWVRNLRAAGRAAVTQGRHSDTLEAVELPADVAAMLVRDALAPFRRSSLLRRVVGPTARPPAGVLRYFGVRIDDTLDDYLVAAGRQPLFELRAPVAR